MANGVFKVAPFDGLIFIYQTDYASKRVFWKFIDFELYELYYASYLCRGIGQTSCSFEHVSCFGGVPVAPDRPCLASARAEALSYLAVKLFSKNSNLCVADT